MSAIAAATLRAARPERAADRDAAVHRGDPDRARQLPGRARHDDRQCVGADHRRQSRRVVDARHLGDHLLCGRRGDHRSADRLARRRSSARSACSSPAISALPRSRSCAACRTRSACCSGPASCSASSAARSCRCRRCCCCASSRRRRRRSPPCIWAMTTLVGPVAGPILGGIICDNYGWPWIFFIKVPIAAAGGLRCCYCCAGQADPKSQAFIDKVGLGSARRLGRRAADHARRRPQPGLVRLARDPDARHRRGHRLRRLPDLGADREEPDRRSQDLPPSRLRRRRDHLRVGFGGFFASIVLLPLWLQTNMGYTATWAGYATAWWASSRWSMAPFVGQAHRPSRSAAVWCYRHSLARRHLAAARLLVGQRVGLLDAGAAAADPGRGHAVLLRAADHARARQRSTRRDRIGRRRDELPAHDVRRGRDRGRSDDVGKWRRRARGTFADRNAQRHRLGDGDASGAWLWVRTITPVHQPAGRFPRPVPSRRSTRSSCSPPCSSSPRRSSGSPPNPSMPSPPARVTRKEMVMIILVGIAVFVTSLLAGDR